MKIIEATWEKRNLGCDAYEIILELSDLDQWEYVEHSIQKLLVNNNYVVIKTPVGSFELNQKIAKLGFYFAEVLHSIKLDLKKYEIPKQYQHFYTRCSFEILEKNYEIWEKEIINKVSTFNTDRISLNPRFGIETGNLRYKNWISDLFENPESQVIIFYFNEKKVGFAVDIWDKENSVVNSILNAVFAEYLGSNFCGIGLSKLYIHYKNSNFKYILGHVSSNNLNIIHWSCDMSYEIFNNQNIFIYNN